MVEPSKDAGKRHIDSLSPTGLEADPLTARPENFRMMQQALLHEYAQIVSEVNDRLINVQDQSDTVEILLKRLQSTINDENTQKAQKITGMRGMMVT